MTPRTVITLVLGLWLVIGIIVVGYPLRSGRIRVGLEPVYRDSAPRAFWTAYLVSSVLFALVSVAAGLLLRAILH